MLRSKLVVVTGASRGLGLDVCRLLLDSGYIVAAVSRHYSDELSCLAARYGSRLKYFTFDLGQVESLTDLVKSITNDCGRVYGLVNNAAIGIDGVLSTMHEKDIANSIRVNLESPLILTKYVSRSMLLNGSGRIVNISSIIANTGFSGLSVYGATKAGMVGFTKSLARELGKANITVNVVAPGYMQTDMTSGLGGDKLLSIKRRSSLGRLASTEEVAKAVKFLLSEEAGAITGTVLTVDCGSTA